MLVRVGSGFRTRQQTLDLDPAKFCRYKNNALSCYPHTYINPSQFSSSSHAIFKAYGYCGPTRHHKTVHYLCYYFDKLIKINVLLNHHSTSLVGAPGPRVYPPPLSGPVAKTILITDHASALARWEVA